MNNKKTLEGIKGWLIIPAIEIIISIPSLCFYILTMIISANKLGILSDLFSSRTSFYSIYTLIFSISQILCMGILTFFYFYLAYLFFSKDYRTLKWYIVVQLFDIIISIIFYILFVFGLSLFSYSNESEIIISLVCSVIWIVYFLTSVRVKNTFINNKPDYMNIVEKIIE